MNKKTQVAAATRTVKKRFRLAKIDTQFINPAIVEEFTYLFQVTQVNGIPALLAEMLQHSSKALPQHLIEQAHELLLVMVEVDKQRHKIELQNLRKFIPLKMQIDIDMEKFDSYFEARIPRT